MKRVLIAVLLCVLATPALADWSETFQASYAEKGLDAAVMEAVEAGTGPGLIVAEAMKIEGLNPQDIVTALYSAGVIGSDIMAAAADNGISELMVDAGHKQFLEQSGDQVADTQAYSDNGRRVRRGPPTVVPPSGGRGRPFASPSKP